MTNIDVAVAVIHFGEQYLLGFRNAKQHQGNRYEFIGGKIEANESAKQALIREVLEEIGLDIGTHSVINPLGVLRHHYADVEVPSNSKRVCLHVFRVALSEQQFIQFADQKKGCESQQLQWVSLEDLIDHKYPLPDANKTILQWLRLPNTIAITQEVGTVFAVEDSAIGVASSIAGVACSTASIDSSTACKDQSTGKDQQSQQWLNYYQQKLPRQACVYVRLKQSSLAQRKDQVLALLAIRPDIKLIIDYELANHLHEFSGAAIADQIIAQHLTQQACADKGIKLLSALPLTVSAHSEASIQQANKLAQYRLNHNLSPVVGVFVSPVQATNTHPEATALGWEGFSDLAQGSEVPVIALGGMGPEDIDQVRNYQGDKVAGIRKFLT